jgi:proline dehydrogenase
MAFRVVKGEWPDPEAPAVDPGRGFLDVVTHLAGRARSVRIATHDSRLAKQSVQILRDAGTPCDLELLYGFPVRKLLPEALKLGIPIRIYVPFGHGWIPYCAGYVRRRPAFMWWLIRDSLAGRYQDSFSQVEPPTAR